MAHLALRDLRLIDGALDMDITSYDTGPVGDPAPFAAAPDASSEPASVRRASRSRG
jgi:hypothetical protein